MDGFYQYIYICMIINIMDGVFFFLSTPTRSLAHVCNPPAQYKYV